MKLEATALDRGVQDLSCTDVGADIDEVIEVGSAQALAPHGELGTASDR